MAGPDSCQYVCSTLPQRHTTFCRCQRNSACQHEVISAALPLRALTRCMQVHIKEAIPRHRLHHVPTNVHPPFRPSLSH
jgi:hypothetical protein